MVFLLLGFMGACSLRGTNSRAHALKLRRSVAMHPLREGGRKKGEGKGEIREIGGGMGGVLGPSAAWSFSKLFSFANLQTLRRRRSRRAEPPTANSERDMGSGTDTGMM